MVSQEESVRVLSKGIDREYNLYDLLKRPDVHYSQLMTLQNEEGAKVLQDALTDNALVEQLEIEVKYSGYVDRQKAEVSRSVNQESVRLPNDIDYTGVNGLSKEVQQKLNLAKPETIGQASRIQGITPAAISLLMVHLKKRSLIKGNAAGATENAA